MKKMGQQKTARTFFAIPLEESIREEVSEIIKFLQQQKWGDQIKWSVPENLHVTLRFLGDIPEEKIEPLCERVTATLQEITSFALPVGEIMLFPSTSHGHAIVVSHPLTDDLAKLVHALELVITEFGFDAEKRTYRPHLTLGRLHGHHAPDLSAIPQKLPAQLNVREVIFYRSELGEHKSNYTILRKFKLK
jgi:2'-5' RNA ligase